MHSKGSKREKGRQDVLGGDGVKMRKEGFEGATTSGRLEE